MPRSKEPKDVVDDVRLVRAQIAKRFGYDLTAYVRHLRRKFGTKGRRILKRPLINTPSTPRQTPKPVRSPV